MIQKDKKQFIKDFNSFIARYLAVEKVIIVNKSIANFIYNNRGLFNNYSYLQIIEQKYKRGYIFDTLSSYTMKQALDKIVKAHFINAFKSY